MQEHEATHSNETISPIQSAMLDEMDDVVREHRPYLIRYVNSQLNDLDAAETIAQECFLRAYAARSRYRGESSVRTWLTAIALNLVRDHLRSRQRSFWRSVGSTAVDVTEISDQVAGKTPTPEAKVLQGELLQRIWDAAEAMTEKQRQVFVMRYRMDMPFSEIAMKTGMNLSTLKSTLMRGIKVVRAQLGYTNDSRPDPESSRRIVGFCNSAGRRPQPNAEKHISLCRNKMEDSLKCES